MKKTSKLLFYVPLFTTVLFIFLVLFLQEKAVEFSADDTHFENVFVMILAFIALLDMGIVLPRMFMPKVLDATTREEVINQGLTPMVMTEVPVLFGFILFFMFGSLVYFGAFMLLGLASWLYFYRKIEEKLSTV